MPPIPSASVIPLPVPTQSPSPRWGCTQLQSAPWTWSRPPGFLAPAADCHSDLPQFGPPDLISWSFRAVSAASAALIGRMHPAATTLEIGCKAPLSGKNQEYQSFAVSFCLIGSAPGRSFLVCFLEVLHHSSFLCLHSIEFVPGYTPNL